MKHTKGPWITEKIEGHYRGYANWETFDIRSTANVCLAVVGEVDRYHEEDHEGNARLMAAAPAYHEHGYNLAILVLQSEGYKNPEIRDEVDNVLDIWKKIERGE